MWEKREGSVNSDDGVQADKKKLDADQALDNVEDSHKRAKDLNTQAQALFKKIQGRCHFLFSSFFYSKSDPFKCSAVKPRNKWNASSLDWCFSVCLNCVLLTLCVASPSDLLRQLQDASANGASVTPDELMKMQEEAERMVREMEGRNLNDQKDAAEKERDQARKRMILFNACPQTHTHTHT